MARLTSKNLDAGISADKINVGSNSVVVVSDGSGNLDASSVTTTVLGYTANLTSDAQAQINAKISSSEKGANSGVATLDSGGKVPVSQLPNSIMEYQGTWSAATNTPTLANGVGSAGDVYVCSAGGTVNFGAGNITFVAGDWAIYNGSIWEKSVNSNAVASVNGYTGVVNLTQSDIGTVPVSLGGTGLSAIGTANYLIGADSGATNNEYKALAVTAAGSVTVPSGQTISLPDGSVSAPAITFTNGSMGLYRVGADNLGIAVGGSEGLDLLRVGSGQVNVGFGIAASAGAGNFWQANRTFNGSVFYTYGNQSSGTSSATVFQIANGPSSNYLTFENYAYATSPAYLAGGAVVSANSNMLFFNIANEYASGSIRFNVGGRTLATERMRLNTADLTLNAGISLKMNGATSGTLTVQPNATTTSYSVTMPNAQGASNTYLKNDGSGGLSWASATPGYAVVSKTTTYTATTADDVILCSSSGGAWTLSLYDATGNSGKQIIIKKTDSSTNVVTIDPAASQTIDGLATFSLSKQYQEVTIVCDGSNWAIVSFYSANEILTTTSNVKTPAGSNQWHQLTNNSLTLTPGSWRLVGAAKFSNNGSAAAYQTYEAGWFSANGADSGSTPTALSSAANLTINSLQLNAYYNAGASGQAQYWVYVPTVVVTVTANTTVYLDTYALMNTAANSQVTAYATAERIR